MHAYHVFYVSSLLHVSFKLQSYKITVNLFNYAIYNLVTQIRLLLIIILAHQQELWRNLKSDHAESKNTKRNFLLSLINSIVI